MWKVVALILILVVAGGLTVVAYKYPGGYKTLSRWLLFVCLGTFLLLLGYSYGHFRAQFKTGKTDANNGLPFTEHEMIYVVLGIVVFLQILRWLPELTKREGKNDAGKNEPPKST
jgi:hypothetical protein